MIRRGPAGFQVSEADVLLEAMLVLGCLQNGLGSSSAFGWCLTVRLDGISMYGGTNSVEEKKQRLSFSIAKQSLLSSFLRAL